jgi:transcriptional regulator with XRE-family HTH domain
MPLKIPTTVFGQRLREARTHAAIAQDKLGVKIGLDEGTASARMSRYESGVHEPPFGIALKIAGALHLPAAFFYCEDDELAKILLLWGRASRKEKDRIKAIFESEIASPANSG